MGYYTNDQNKEILYSKNRVALCHQTLGLTLVLRRREKKLVFWTKRGLVMIRFSLAFCISSFSNPGTITTLILTTG